MRSQSVHNVFKVRSEGGGDLLLFLTGEWGGGGGGGESKAVMWSGVHKTFLTLGFPVTSPPANAVKIQRCRLSARHMYILPIQAPNISKPRA